MVNIETDEFIQMGKKELYESIMAKIAVQVKKAINESIEDDATDVEQAEETYGMVCVKGTDWDKYGKYKGWTCFFEESYPFKTPRPRATEGPDAEKELAVNRVVLMRDPSCKAKGKYYNMHIETAEKNGAYAGRLTDKEISRVLAFVAAILPKGAYIIPNGGTNPGGISMIDKLGATSLECVGDSYDVADCYWSNKVDPDKMDGWFDRHPDSWRFKSDADEAERPTINNTVPVTKIFRKK